MENKILALAGKLKSTVGRAVKNVNKGGCGIAAAALHDALLQAGEKPELLMVCGIGYSRGGADDTASELVGQPVSWSHVVVKVGETFLEGTGLYGADEASAVNNSMKWYSCRSFVSMSRETLGELIKTVPWNPRFNRGAAPRLEAVIRRAVSETVAPINVGHDFKPANKPKRKGTQA